MNWIGDGESGAIFDPSRRYRYTLWRRFDEYEMLDMVAFVGLNPSTADETANDPTVMRCINYAKSWGFKGYVMLNAFAWRDTLPQNMRAQPDPVGPSNDEAILWVASRVGMVVCAWGNHGSFRGRSRGLTDMLLENGIDLHSLGENNSGEPKHPLYLRSDLAPKLWKGVNENT